MKIKRYDNSAMGENIYLLVNEGYGVIIDPGVISKELNEYIDKENIIIEAIILTHGHFDHIGASDYYAEKYNVDIYIHANDMHCLLDGKYNLLNDNLVTTPAKELKEELKLDHFKFNIKLLPGHSLGSCAIIIDNYMFSGDILFKGSIGRSDFNGSNNLEMQETVKKLKAISTNYIVYPGHGEKTTIFDEQKSNIYLM